MKGFFFNKDSYMEGQNLDTKIKGFLEGFKKIFGEQIVDEIFIIRCDGNKVVPIYFFCAHARCEKITEVTDEIKSRVEKKKMEDFDFFVKNIISKRCLINNEGIIAKDQMGGLFDAVFRMDDYYVGMNNTDSSFRELQEKLGMSEEAFIKIVKNLYSELKK